MGASGAARLFGHAVSRSLRAITHSIERGAHDCHPGSVNSATAGATGLDAGSMLLRQGCIHRASSPSTTASPYQHPWQPIWEPSVQDSHRPAAATRRCAGLVEKLILTFTDGTFWHPSEIA